MVRKLYWKFNSISTKKFLKKVQRRILTILIISLANLVKIIPLTLCRKIASPLARIAIALIPRIKNDILNNLNLAYGDSISPQEKQKILFESTKNMILVALELPHLPKLAKTKYQNIATYKGDEYLQHYLENKQGALFISAHLGNWEMMASLMASHGYKVTEIVREFNDPWLNRYIDSLRTQASIKTLPKDNSANEIIRLLKDGEFVGMLIDQSPRDNAVPVFFFSQPCWATIGPAYIYSRTKVPVHPVSMIRNSDNTLELVIHPPLELVNTKNWLKDILTNTQICQNAIETLIKQHPEQWLWVHKRWKQRKSLEEYWEKRKDKLQTMTTNIN